MVIETQYIVNDKLWLKMDEKHQTSMDKKKRKRVSKKSKRSWRKHTDIKDIEDHLEEVRRQERLGGVLSLKKNDQLFFLDKNTTECDKDTKRDKSKCSLPQSHARVFLEPYMKPVAGRKHKTSPSKFKKDKQSKSDKSSSEEDEGGNKKMVKKRQPSEDKEKNKGFYDLWDTNNSKSSEVVKDQHYLKATKKCTIKQPDTAYQVRSKVPALVVCHPGASYNPTFEDHQSLLMTACRVELVKEKKAEKIQKKLQLPADEELVKLPSWEEEMSQGLFDVENQSTTEERSSENEEQNDMLLVSTNKARKSRKERKKEVERKKEEQKLQMLRKEKTKENDVFRMKNIKKNIRQTDEKTLQRQQKKRDKDIENSVKPKRLGRLKFEEMNIEVQLSDELAGSLRRLKPEGNLFQDRYKSLQRRNIVEPRKLIAAHRKYPLKEYQKRSFKNYDLQEKLKEKRKK